MEPWIRAHLLTSHPWDVALHLEAINNLVEADMWEIWSRLWPEADVSFTHWKIMFSYLAQQPIKLGRFILDG